MQQREPNRPSSEGLRIPVIYGSVRSERQGIRVARFMVSELQRRGCEPALIDPLEYRLPLLDLMYKEYSSGTAPAELEELARLYRGADGFVIVSGEYNNGIPPALKNLLDHFLEEYFWRPSAIVCYSAGRFGGVRAAMQLRMTLGELGMPSIPSLLPIANVSTAFTQEGIPTEAHFAQRSERFFSEFFWYMKALKAARLSGVPY
ncbi:MAG: NAD(P)H-dependent oxidoreductase [Candidatus Eremiobacteraeota bacterium]|nr:NAD(P)H-dependent oxidoreductase [Candidatus Eremiobacteraeota bacterium]